jgi:hypothetical protein
MKHYSSTPIVEALNRIGDELHTLNEDRETFASVWERLPYKRHDRFTERFKPTFTQCQIEWYIRSGTTVDLVQLIKKVLIHLKSSKVEEVDVDILDTKAYWYYMNQMQYIPHNISHQELFEMSKAILKELLDNRGINTGMALVTEYEIRNFAGC